MSKDEYRGDRDAFWDIGKLLPKRREPSARPFTAPTLTSVTDDAPPSPPSASRRLTAFPAAPGEVVTTVYAPKENALIRSVTVKRTVGGHSFYEQFRRDAERYFDTPGTSCDYTPFFSFTPQYNQLSEEQMAYYLYFRSEVRCGRYPRTDKGYFFLLVYEIIHLSSRIPPAEGACLLAALWGAYRKDLDGIDRYMAPWLSDYCLLHVLPCPRDLSPECLSAASEADAIGFYFGTATVATPEGVLRLLSLSSDYRFEASRALTDETKALFHRHITGAMARVFSHLFSAGMLSLSERPERQHRRAFLGTLCAHNIRAELEVEYISLRHTDALRRTVSLAVKHTENLLRAVLGIRARLSTVGLDTEVRSVIDRYFDAVRSSLPSRHPAPATPAYEKLYDAPDRGLDSASAKEIEARSWQLTRRLVTEEETDADEMPTDASASTAEMASHLTAPTPPLTAAPAPIAPPSEATAVPLTEALLAVGAPPVEVAASLLAPPVASLAETISAFLAGGAAPRELARRRACPLPLLAEEVNEAFLAAYGDVLLEPRGDDYTLIEDYREDTEEWLTTLTK